MGVPPWEREEHRAGIGPVHQADTVARPERSYLIAGTQRTGTTLLCRALADTGVAGLPDEYFLSVDPVAQPGWATWEDGPFGVLLGATDRAGYLDAVYRLGTTDNGVFGVKLMANNLPWAIDAFRELPEFAGLDRAGVLQRALPEVRIVHVTRRDRVAQAVSWARAAQDGVWAVPLDEAPCPVGEPAYDAELIGNLVRLIGEGEEEWRRVFAELEVEPCPVVYEDLTDEGGWRSTLERVLAHLDLDPEGVTLPAPGLTRQRDGLNADWVARFRQARRGRVR